MELRRILPLVVALGLLAGLAACGGDDPVTPAGDTTPPQLVGARPQFGINVAVGDSVILFFSEAMDPASADGNITLSSGTVTGSVWYDARTLAFSHTDWPEGTMITVTVGAALADLAGNTMHTYATFTFWTASSQLLLLASDPASGATDVNRDVGILLTFSETPTETSFNANVTVTDVGPIKATFPYTATLLGEGQYLVRPDATLPADTQIYVMIGTGLVAEGSGHALATAQVRSFTTGSATDTTPPTIVAADPANGAASVPRDKGYLRLTFSEPVDPNTIEPSRWDLAFYVMSQEYGIEPFWSEGNTVLTVELPATMPPGTPVSLEFVGFTDLAGNAQATPYAYDITFAGTPDMVPVVDGERYYEEVAYSEGDVGSVIPTGDGTDAAYMRIDVTSGTAYREVWYQSSGFTVPTGDWESYDKTASGLLWTGFESVTKGAAAGRDWRRSADKAVSLSPPLNILPLPVSARTWTGNTSVTIPGEGDYTAVLAGRIVGRENLDLPGTTRYFLRDAWRVERTLTISLDGSPAFVEETTTWYVPNWGEMHREYRREDDATWYEEDVWRFPSDLAKEARGLGTAAGGSWSR